MPMFRIETDDTDDDEDLGYSDILQEEEYEDEDVQGFTTREYCPTGSHAEVVPWDPSESNFFRIQ
jgi:hypothetical protein